ncbi:GAP family protein [Streptomyces sp. KL116D]|uniref:GAP family protein n=1 Tax=Streptomyces sp. KL116D TaxID=3045152 RepID=UPI0035585BFF
MCCSCCSASSSGRGARARATRPRRPAGCRPSTSSPAKAAGLAALLAVANPKNLVLALGGAVSIASSDASAGGRTVAAALMVVIGSLCALAPLARVCAGRIQLRPCACQLEGVDGQAQCGHHDHAARRARSQVRGDAISGLAG